MSKSDIKTTADIEKMVNTFYQKIRNDDMLGPIFALRITDDKWPLHLEKMYRFWGTLLLYTQNYSGSPFDKHIGLPVQENHFNHWVTLFCQTVDELFEGNVAEIAKERAQNIALTFSYKLTDINKIPITKAEDTI